MQRFIVALVIDLGAGVCAHLLVAADGDAWLVHRLRDRLYLPPWEAGEIVIVPLTLREDEMTGDRWFEPDWSGVHADDARHTPLGDTYRDVVEELWGPEAERQ